jgi:hypothetical protein
MSSDDDMNEEALMRFLERPRQPLHLQFESQLVPYVEGTADAAETEIIETHLEECPACREDVEDLRETRRALQRRRPRRARWAVLSAAAALPLIVTALVFFRRPDPPPVTPRVVVPPPVTETRMAVTPSRTYANPAWQRLIATAIAEKALSFPASLAELTPAADTLRDTGDAVQGSLDPVGRVIRDVRPRLTWTARAGATYVVLIYAGDEEVARSKSLRVPYWTPPRPLARGRTYAWQVNVRTDETDEILPRAEEPQALFRVTSVEDEKNIDAALRAHPDDPLLHAVVYAAAGLREEAEAALRKAAADGDRDAQAILATGKS